MVIDAEGHPREWRRRVEDLGGDVSQVAYWEHPGGELVLDDYTGLMDMVVVDSAAYFWPGTDDWAAAAVAMQGQAKVAGVPVVVIAHKPKSQPKGHAYGSVFWGNASRINLELADGVLEVVKLNDLLGMEKGHRWDLTLEKDGHGRITTYTVEEAVDEESPEHRLRAYLSEWRTKQDVMDYLGVGASTAQRMLNAALGLETSQPSPQEPKRWRVVPATTTPHGEDAHGW